MPAKGVSSIAVESEPAHANERYTTLTSGRSAPSWAAASAAGAFMERWHRVASSSTTDALVADSGLLCLKALCHCSWVVRFIGCVTQG